MSPLQMCATGLAETRPLGYDGEDANLLQNEAIIFATCHGLGRAAIVLQSTKGGYKNQCSIYAARDDRDNLQMTPAGTTSSRV